MATQLIPIFLQITRDGRNTPLSLVLLLLLLSQRTLKAYFTTETIVYQSPF